MVQAKILPEIQASGGALFCPVEIGGVKINSTTPREHELNQMVDSDACPHYGLEHLGILTDDIDAIFDPQNTWPEVKAVRCLIRCEKD